MNVHLNIAEGSAFTEELLNFLGTQASLMQSGVVINKAHARVVANNPKLLVQPVVLQVQPVPRTTIFFLQATCADREYVQPFLQAVMDEYIALKKDMRAATSDTTVDGLTQEITRLERERREADADLVAFQSTNSVVLSQDNQGNNSAASYLAALNQRPAWGSSVS